MKKKVIKFSIRKYRKWCKENNEPFYPWADECKNGTVENWNGKNGVCKGYLILPVWMVIRYE